MNDARADMRSQNSRSRSTPRAGGLPAISAALIAPIDTPAIQVGCESDFGETCVHARLVRAECTATL